MNEASVNYDVLSPVKFLERSAMVYPEKTAVVYGDIRRTYEEFQERVYRLANALKQKGIGKGDKVAFVVPKPGTRPTEESIIAFCKENLARFKAPKLVEFSELPKTATGKIQKFKLREKEWQGRERKVN